MPSTEPAPPQTSPPPQPAQPPQPAEPPHASQLSPPSSPSQLAQPVQPAQPAQSSEPSQLPQPSQPSQASQPDCAQQLKQLWPALFAGAPKPLKLRIQLDIQQRAPGRFTKQALSAFFRRYTGSTSYLNAIARGKQRFDLDGQPSGEISDEHRKVAADELARRRANQEQRHALEQQQRRNRAGLLHDFERTTLTRANFCALKQVAEEELDGLLALARQEAAEPRGPQRDEINRRTRARPGPRPANR